MKSTDSERSSDSGADLDREALRPEMPQTLENLPEGHQATIEFLLRRMRHRDDFPALSESVSTINHIASSETESSSRLAEAILKDFALTNKLLRLVNAVVYRQAGGGTISTVSRAVVVLGFDAVRNLAVTVRLLEHIDDKSLADPLKEVFLRAHLAAILAKTLASTVKMPDLEQVYICALFQNLGRLLVQYYFPEEAAEIRRLVRQQGLQELQAAIPVLGIGLADLGMVIAHEWGFPPLIVHSMRPLPPGTVHKPHTASDRLQIVSSLSNELCALIAGTPESEQDQALQSLLQRFAPALSLTKSQVMHSTREAVDEVGDFMRVVQASLLNTPFAQQMQHFVCGTRPGDVCTVNPENSPILPLHGTESGDPSAMLAAGIQEISSILVEDFKLNDILRVILEIMYRAMGFSRVLLCVKEVRSNSMQGRFGFGTQINTLSSSFHFSLNYSPDIFHAATSHGADVLIENVDDPSIAGRIPDWYRKAVSARAFILLPLVIKGNPVGLIYADQSDPAGIDLPENQLALLRTLRNQAVLAIKQGS